MIVLFTDFGLEGPYLGQVKAVLLQDAPHVPIVDLFANAPACDPWASAYLLDAYTAGFPPATVFLCVVDPGVGSKVRKPVVVNIDGRWFVGPDNGLFNRVVQSGYEVEWWEIVWRPEVLSATFHGRDLFAPVAARLAKGELPAGMLKICVRPQQENWPPDLMKIIYIDHFGNALTGIRSQRIADDAILVVKNHQIAYAHHYAEVPQGQVFWYRNSNSLIEIAMNCKHAACTLGLSVGDPVSC